MFIGGEIVKINPRQRSAQAIRDAVDTAPGLGVGGARFPVFAEVPVEEGPEEAPDALAALLMDFLKGGAQ